MGGSHNFICKLSKKMKVFAIITLLIVAASCNQMVVELFNRFNETAEHAARVVEILEGNRRDQINPEIKATLQSFSLLSQDFASKFNIIVQHLDTIGYNTIECQFDIVNTLNFAKGLLYSFDKKETNETFWFVEKVLKSVHSTVRSCQHTIDAFNSRINKNKDRNCTEAVGVVAFVVAFATKKNARVPDVIRAIPSLAASATLLVERCGAKPQVKNIRLNEDGKKPHANRLRELFNRLKAHRNK
eukprot:TRINITY_DN7313_c0_g1_i1.p1 TRINITY_DN7313_c0_g1~~TRINITY_DN7313_c0_g1_i1.p1  ORF type:complete len:256 (-),score=65.06 TRINITY_DN7313_c0_g1_i1:130-861(-)